MAGGFDGGSFVVVVSLFFVVEPAGGIVGCLARYGASFAFKVGALGERGLGFWGGRERKAGGTGFA